MLTLTAVFVACVVVDLPEGGQAKLQEGDETFDNPYSGEQEDYEKALKGAEAEADEDSPVNQPKESEGDDVRPEKSYHYVNTKEDKKFEAEVMQGRITGEHVADYMTEMLDESPEKYQQLFGSKGIEKKNTRVTYGDCGITADGVVSMYEKCFAAIRADPTRTKGAACKIDKKFRNTAKRTYAERKAAIEAKKEELQAAQDALDESSEEEDDDE